MATTFQLTMESNGEKVGGYVNVEAVGIAGTTKFKLHLAAYLYSLTGRTEPIDGDFSIVLGNISYDTVLFSYNAIVSEATPKNDDNPEENCVFTSVSEEIDYSDSQNHLSVTSGYIRPIDCRLEFFGYGVGTGEYFSGKSIHEDASLELVYHDGSIIYTSVKTAQMGEDLFITIQRNNSEYTHTLWYQFGTSSKTLIAQNVANSYIWSIPDLAGKCNNAVSGTCIIGCDTYLNGFDAGNTETEVVLTVPDPSPISIQDDDIILGNEYKIGCQRNSTNFTVKLDMEVQETTFQITKGKIDSAKWTPEYAIAKQFPTLTYATGTLKCTTFNGTAEVGSRSVTVRVIVPENDITRPAFTLDGLVLTPVSSLTDAFEGLYLRGKTGVKAAFTASSECSEIREYALSIGGQNATGNPATIELLVSDGTVNVNAKVTDARGYATTVTTTISVFPYRNPRIIPCDGHSQIICDRAMDNGELSSNGTYLAIKAGKSFSSLVIGGTEQNNCTLRYRWKPNGAASYSDWITLLAEDSVETEVSLLVGNVVNDLQRSYMVEMEATDALDGRHTLTFQIMTAAISFVLYDGPDGAGFGKYPEEPHVVDIASHMTLRVRGKLVVDGSDWIDIGLADGVSESIYPYGKKEISGCHYQVTDGNHVYVAFDCIFEYSGSSMTINQNAIPEEHRPKRTTYALCPINDRGIALVSVDISGYIRVEWVQNLTDMARTVSTAVEWMDGYLDYWT